MYPKTGGKGIWGSILNASTMGLHLVSASVIGLATGWYLDKWLDTKPWLTLFMLLMGVIAGFKNMFEEASRIQAQERKESEAAGRAPKEPPKQGGPDGQGDADSTSGPDDGTR